MDKVVENEGLKKTVENLERKVKIRYERARYCQRTTPANDQLKHKTKEIYSMTELVTTTEQQLQLIDQNSKHIIYQFLQARNSDAASILKAKEHLEGVYKSLQRQFQVWIEN